MRILIPYDVDTTGKRNPWLFLLMRSLHRHPEVDVVQHGFGWLMEEGEWDIIHLHWPEILVTGLLPGPFSESRVEQHHIDRLVQLLKGWKRRGSRILMTLHNEEPHVDRSDLTRELYRELYALADGFVHMGRASEAMLKQNHPEEVRGKPGFLIPHGDYSYFPRDRSRQECREELGIAPDTRLILAFGAIRTQDELELGIDAFNRAAIPDSLYMMVGKLPYPFRSNPKHFTVRRKLYLNRLKRRPIQAIERAVPSNEVQLYLKSADLLFIPRIRALNSGNIALGFTFGKVVVGPEYGVIGEQLAETGNPQFDPDRPESVRASLMKGLKLMEEGHGKRNEMWARQHLDWSRIADATIGAYQQLQQATTS